MCVLREWIQVRDSHGRGFDMLMCSGSITCMHGFIIGKSRQISTLHLDSLHYTCSMHHSWCMDAGFHALVDFYRQMATHSKLQGREKVWEVTESLHAKLMHSSIKTCYFPAETSWVYLVVGALCCPKTTRNHCNLPETWLNACWWRLAAFLNVQSCICWCSATLLCATLLLDFCYVVCFAI